MTDNGVPNLSDEEEITVTVTAAEITVTPTSISFGQRDTNNGSDYESVTVTNSGSADLTIVSATLTGDNPDQFVIDTTGFNTTLAPGESSSFNVQFLPTSSGWKYAFVTIASNDPDEANIDVSLSGQGETASITTSSFPEGQVGIPYSEGITATGVHSPWTLALNEGSGPLPDGLSLTGDSVNGYYISGIPSAAGSFSFTLKVTDADGDTATQDLSIHVKASPEITTASLPDGQVGTPYVSQTLAITGGTTPYSWSISTGSLPAGLTLDAAAGVISGTPTGAGSFAFTVRVTDNVGATDEQALSISVRQAPQSGEHHDGPTYNTPSLKGLTSSSVLLINEFGFALNSTQLKTVDDKVSLDIDPDTRLLGATVLAFSAMPVADPHLHWQRGIAGLHLRSSRSYL